MLRIYISSSSSYFRKIWAEFPLYFLLSQNLPTRNTNHASQGQHIYVYLYYIISHHRHTELTVSNKNIKMPRLISHAKLKLHLLRFPAYLPFQFSTLRFNRTSNTLPSVRLSYHCLPVYCVASDIINRCLTSIPFSSWNQRLVKRNSFPTAGSIARSKIQRRVTS